VKLNTEQFQIPSEGSHVATFIDYDDLGERSNPFEPGETQHQLKLIFSIPGDNGPVNQYAWVTASLNEEAKLYEIVRALLGRKPKGEYELDELKGRSCLVEIEHYQSKGKKRSKIVDYSPNLQGFSATDNDLPDFEEEQ